MSLSDKIKELIGKQGLLSSKEITTELEKRFGIQKKQRTIQRHIQFLVDSGELIPVSGIEREIKYKLMGETENGKKEITSYLLKRYWNQEQKIEEMIISNPRNANIMLDVFMKTLPPKYKDKLHSYINNFLEQAQKQWKCSLNCSECVSNQECYLSNYIEGVCSILHEMEEAMT